MFSFWHYKDESKVSHEHLEQKEEEEKKKGTKVA